MRDIVIAGGGLSGCLLALAMTRRRPELDILLVEQGSGFGGNHIWSFFDDDVAGTARNLLDPLISKHWDGHEIRFPQRRRKLKMGYNSVRSTQLHDVVRSVLPADRCNLGRAVVSLAADHVVLEGGERVDAACVIDARGPRAMPGLDLGWQKFVGRTYRFDRPHGCEWPVIMDATVNQEDGYRFVYSLPFSDRELMVEDTYYSASSALDAPLIGGRVDSHVQRTTGIRPEMLSEEQGVLPVLLGGSVDSLWPAQAPVARLGISGGFFHPTTGYSLPDAARNAVLIADQQDLSGPAVHALLKSRAKALWKERSFYQLLNRMLFRAAAPNERYRVLEHFYRLPEPVIARFYAGRTTALDKLRILSGRPPVPVRRAFAAMRRQAL